MWDLAFEAAGFRGALLNGWSLTGIVTLQSGVPIAVTHPGLCLAQPGAGAQLPQPQSGGDASAYARGAGDSRLEAFNVTKIAPALGAPNGVFGSAAFGTITAAGDPRVLQVAAKVRF